MRAAALFVLGANDLEGGVGLYSEEQFVSFFSTVPSSIIPPHLGQRCRPVVPVAALVASLTILPGGGPSVSAFVCSFTKHKTQNTTHTHTHIHVCKAENPYAHVGVEKDVKAHAGLELGAPALLAREDALNHLAWHMRRPSLVSVACASSVLLFLLFIVAGQASFNQHALHGLQQPLKVLVGLLLFIGNPCGKMSVNSTDVS